MKKKVKYFKGFTLVEVLLVMGIFIILTVIGFNGFLTIRESFIAKENVELIIQDIESIKLKAMNMEGGKEETWIYGFGIDFTNVVESSSSEDYEFFKWCSPVTEFENILEVSGTDYSLTGGILPNLYPGDVNQIMTSIPVQICGNNVTNYQNGSIPSCYFPEGECIYSQTGLIHIKGEQITLLDRGAKQMEILDSDSDGVIPAFVVFESLTGRAMIYNRPEGINKFGSVENYLPDATFNKNNMVPLDIVLHRKRSNKFDVITIYPLSGEVINHVYDESETPPDPSICTNELNCITVEGKTYRRYGIREEIDSFRD